MSVVLSMVPKALAFARQTPFQIGDQFNGQHRGTWWYRTQEGILTGPFATKEAAAGSLVEGHTIAPFQDQYRKWWWTGAGGDNHGPFDSLRDCDADLLGHQNA